MRWCNQLSFSHIYFTQFQAKKVEGLVQLSKGLTTTETMAKINSLKKVDMSLNAAAEINNNLFTDLERELQKAEQSNQKYEAELNALK